MHSESKGRRDEENIRIEFIVFFFARFTLHNVRAEWHNAQLFRRFFSPAIFIGNSETREIEFVSWTTK